MKAAVLRKLEADVWPRIETGEIQPVIYRVLPIQEAEEAHAILARNENIGKVVLKVRP
jgi:NADPH2:quinone reductase